MTGPVADYFVAAVSVILGLAMLLSSLFDWSRLFRLPKARWLEERSGRTAARLVIGTLGAALIVLGIAIAGGFAPNATS
ncbi:MAG: hypothetical protein KY475_12450 [Planctomycetes bacterium]|nr:hypothetical protein [Planctomycetota bacterium]